MCQDMVIQLCKLVFFSRVSKEAHAKEECNREGVRQNRAFITFLNEICFNFRSFVM